MRSRNGIFWHSLFLTLLLLLPIMGAVLFFAGQRQKQDQLRQVAAARGGISIETGAQNTHRLLLVVQQDEPAFLLLRIDAPAQQLTFCALPGDLLVAAPAGQTTLADCTIAAGPGRAAQLLGGTAATGETTVAELDYLAATPACWADCIGSETAARIDTGALGLRREESVVEVAASEAADFLQEAAAEGNPLLARAALWEAFARQNTKALQAMPEALRTNSARTLTSLLAQDLAALEQTLDYLARQTALAMDYLTPETTPAPGGTMLTEEGMQTLQTLLR